MPGPGRARLLQCSGVDSVGVVTEASCVRVELPDPLPEPTEAIACDIAAAATLTANVSDADRPLLSVAVTFKLSEVADVGAVPLKVSVVPLNFSQAGSAVPLAWVAA
jgi:hypothetical protein